MGITLTRLPVHQDRTQETARNREDPMNPAHGVENVNEGMHNPRPLNFAPKVEFPTFDGNKSRVWICKSKKYFDLWKIADNQKLNLASLYMNGKSKSWMHSYMRMRNNVDWDEFVMDLCARFKENLGSNAVEEFNKLLRKDSLQDYLDLFENLRGLMLQRNPLLPESYFLNSFIGGLNFCS